LRPPRAGDDAAAGGGAATLGDQDSAPE
jgi:hypothetical protein